MCKAITFPLGKGKDAIIDADDWPLVSRYRWGAVGPSPRGKTQYVVTPGRGRREKPLYLHHLLMQPPPHIEVDHLNGNGLDCRRANMELVTHAENCRRAYHPPTPPPELDETTLERRTILPTIIRKPLPPLHRGSVIVLEGVYRDPASGRWCFRVQSSVETIEKSGFATPDDATAACLATYEDIFGKYPARIKVFG